ncbi:4024_t:CDS:2 [Funneliformis mosseae]|uniref:4024_t:CDS:1 n=1 Tax=Funneliformis mosseae TaxID=27381 RepID=A0A9N8W5V3_FUNMO|nr:4024_t:CDS:2 [Funneliformis mosseae]
MTFSISIENNDGEEKSSLQQSSSSIQMAMELDKMVSLQIIQTSMNGLSWKIKLSKDHKFPSSYGIQHGIVQNVPMDFFSLD